MKSVLFLSQRIPYPPNKGEKIRAFAILKHLSSRHRVYAASFIDDEDDWQYVDTIKQYCMEICCLPLDKRQGQVRGLTGLGRGRSASRCHFGDARLTRWVAERCYDAALVSCSSMAHHLTIRPNRVVLDYVDVDSDKWRQYAATRKFPARLIYAREARVLLEEERRLARWADAGTFVSEAEAALFRRLAPESAGKIHGIANGIDHGFFAPSPDFPDPFAGRPTLVFTGAMDYWPNVDAVTWFAAKVLPRLAGLDFAIVGSSPAREVVALAERPGITVTGRVADVRPYLAHAAAVVAPMRVARGIQNKVLEGMAMARKVVTTPQGFEGIDAIPGRDVLVADGARDLAQAVQRALADPSLAGMGDAARRRMVEGYDWSDKLARFEELLFP